MIDTEERNKTKILARLEKRQQIYYCKIVIRSNMCNDVIKVNMYEFYVKLSSVH